MAIPSQNLKSFAFDVYGTLIDTNGVSVLLEELIGSKSDLFMDTWRSKQLEYTFRRGLMKTYVDFNVCTHQALDYTCEKLGLDLSDDKKRDLLKVYDRLPAFPDVESGLVNLKNRGCRLFAFSNGKEESVKNLLTTAKVFQYFDDVISVDAIKTFKPDPAVYSYLLSRTKSQPSDLWLVSSNPFDVIGAVSFGLPAAWVKRSPQALFDPWGIEPTVVIESVRELN